jgi:hypothetical protein
VASTSSEPTGRPALERLAGRLLALMATGAASCAAVGLGLRWLGAGRWSGAAERSLSLATAVMVAAPLVSLLGVALKASRRGDRLGIFAWGALLVTLLGMGLAR